MLIWIFYGVYSDSLFPAVNTQRLAAPGIALCSQSDVCSSMRASGSYRLLVWNITLALDLSLLASTHCYCYFSRSTSISGSVCLSAGGWRHCSPVSEGHGRVESLRGHCKAARERITFCYAGQVFIRQQHWQPCPATDSQGFHHQQRCRYSLPIHPYGAAWEAWHLQRYSPGKQRLRLA